MRCRAVFFIIILLFASCSLFSFSINVDALSLASLFTSGKGGRITTNFNLYQDLRMDFTLGFHRIDTENINLNVFEGNIAFDFFPFPSYGFYTGVSLIHPCYLNGLDCPTSPFINLLDIRIGYQFEIKHFALDFRFNICKPSAFSNDEKILQDNFYQFKKYTFTVLLGWKL